MPVTPLNPIKPVIQTPNTPAVSRKVTPPSIEKLTRPVTQQNISEKDAIDPARPPRAAIFNRGRMPAPTDPLAALRPESPRSAAQPQQADMQSDRQKKPTDASTASQTTQTKSNKTSQPAPVDPSATQKPDRPDDFLTPYRRDTQLGDKNSVLRTVTNDNTLPLSIALRDPEKQQLWERWNNYEQKANHLAEINKLHPPDPPDKYPEHQSYIKDPVLSATEKWGTFDFKYKDQQGREKSYTISIRPPPPEPPSKEQQAAALLVLTPTLEGMIRLAQARRGIGFQYAKFAGSHHGVGPSMVAAVYGDDEELVRHGGCELTDDGYASDWDGRAVQGLFAMLELCPQHPFYSGTATQLTNFPEIVFAEHEQ